MKAVVVIPIYSSIMKSSEKCALVQGLKILTNYDIVFLTFHGLDTTSYNSICKDYPNAKIRYEFFDKKNFDGIDGYNRFCLSLELYDRFVQYDYMLIYQLDAWVFYDALNFWCKQEYDYIGPPFFDDWSSKGKKIVGVGNGGFSLRRISFFRNLLSSNSHILSYYQLLQRCTCLMDYIRMVPKVLFGVNNTPIEYINKKYEQGFNEDIIISVFLKGTRFEPHIPSPQTAMSFAFERFPSMLYEQNGKKLPFGCHAFKKYEYENFWSKYINIRKSV